MLEEASVHTICPVGTAVAVAGPRDGEDEGFGDAVEAGAMAAVWVREVQDTIVPARTRTRRRLAVPLKDPLNVWGMWFLYVPSQILT
jgi:hypothetical protein